MIPVPTDDNGPDMAMVKQYVESDASVKGIWCVPIYANPSGIVYSDDTVRAFAALKPAEKPAEQVLQQRYLSRQFDAKNPPSQNAAKSEADKPVSILSVIRRRNDVQLDMHQIDLIRESLKNSGNKQQFYSYFVKKLGQKQGIELYHSIKSSYTDLVNANLI